MAAHRVGEKKKRKRRKKQLYISKWIAEIRGNNLHVPLRQVVNRNKIIKLFSGWQNISYTHYSWLKISDVPGT